MWLLKKLTEQGPIQYLLSEKKEYLVGRKNADIILDDNSVSRTHCVIYVAPKNECPFEVNTLTGVWLVDKNSKYGTFIEKNKEWVTLKEEEVEPLSVGSIIKFGMLENIWRLEYKPVIGCSSRLTNAQTDELKSLLTSIDGRFINSTRIKQCSFVFVNSITLTIKVLLALIYGVPIVTTNYLKQLVENIKKNMIWPDYKQFRPDIKEPTLIPHLVSLNVDDHRTELFKEKTFFIPTVNQLENLREIIEATGGKCELLKMDGHWQKLADDNVIVIQLPCDKIINPDSHANKFKQLANVLKNKYRVRVVPETEIYQAIAYSSVNKYCNPKSEEFDLRLETRSQCSYGDIIEQDTPQNNIEDLSSNVINNVDDSDIDSGDKGRNSYTNKKRQHSPEVMEPVKRLASSGVGIIKDVLDKKQNVLSANQKETSGSKDVEEYFDEISHKISETFNKYKSDSSAEIDDIIKQNMLIRESLQSELSDFWTKPNDNSKTLSEKRKMDQNDNSNSGKRLCLGSEITTTDSVTKQNKVASDNRVRKIVPNNIKRFSEDVKINAEDGISYIFQWKKEPNSASCDIEELKPSFKKRKPVVVEEVKYTEEEYQKIREMLLKDDWIEWRKKK